jgi:AbrB family looped-hinge helix DNA binding protein
MGTTKLSSKGQIVLPKSVRQARGWEPGTEFVVEATEDGVHLRVKTPFPRTELDDVFGSVRYKGRPKSLEQMSEAVKRAAGRRYRRAVQR